MKHLYLNCALCVALFSGCNSGIQTVPVSGVVCYNGEPVEGAMVVFEPETETATTHSASGITDANGKFSLQTLHAPKPGAMPGAYIAVVSKEEVIPPPELGRDEENRPIYSNNAMPKFIKHLPEKYGVKNMTPLKAEVKNGKNEFQFDLTDQ